MIGGILITIISLLLLAISFVSGLGIAGRALRDFTYDKTLDKWVPKKAPTKGD